MATRAHMLNEAKMRIDRMRATLDACREHWLHACEIQLSQATPTIRDEYLERIDKPLELLEEDLAILRELQDGLIAEFAE